MEIKTQITVEGKTFDLAFTDEDPSSLEQKGKKIHGANGICFYEDKLVICYCAKRSVWELPGGGIEQGESYQEATVREIKEESNMKVISQQYIGCHIFTMKDGREIVNTYSFLEVEPCGDFVTDPDNDITEIKLINPKDIKNYMVGWEKIGDEMMRRAMEMKKKRIQI